MATIKIPQHGGPDGQGLSAEVFAQLVNIIEDEYSTPYDQQVAIDFCFAASKQHEWNTVYKPQLDALVKGSE